nr:MAG TPA: hypothetical protein [Caudoviricetes sp.]
MPSFQALRITPWGFLRFWRQQYQGSRHSGKIDALQDVRLGNE